MTEEHALLSASSAHRWLECTPSALLEAALPDVETPAALEGTRAHSLAEWKVRSRVGLPVGVKPGGVSVEMDIATDAYVDYVGEQGGFAPGVVLRVEERLDFGHVVPGGFGTGDCVIFDPPVLKVIDLKYGVGVQVAALENPQLMLYGLGALKLFEPFDVATVELHVFQPRRGGAKKWVATPEELESWARWVARPAGVIAARGGGAKKPGEWCRFCKLKASCRAREVAYLSDTFGEGKPPEEHSGEELASLLSRIPGMLKWGKEVQEYALREALEGREVPGYALFEGRKTRKYRSEKAARDALAANGLMHLLRAPTLTSLERELGKEKTAEVLGDVLETSSAAPSLKPADSRGKRWEPSILFGELPEDTGDQ